jgi:hypothetical protein
MTLCTRHAEPAPLRTGCMQASGGGVCRLAGQHAGDRMAAAALMSSQGGGTPSSTWCTTIPRDQWRTYADSHYRALLAERLGEMPAICVGAPPCTCGLRGGRRLRTDDHRLSHSAGQVRQHVHTSLSSFWMQLVRAAGHHADLETAHLVPDSHARPADVLETAADTGMLHLHDVTVAHSTAASYVHAVSGRCGAAAAGAARGKSRRWSAILRQQQGRSPAQQQRLQSLDHSPLAFETSGYMHPAARAHFDRLITAAVRRQRMAGHVVERRILHRYWMQRLSCALMSGVAHCLHVHVSRGRDSDSRMQDPGAEGGSSFDAETAVPH